MERDARLKLLEHGDAFDAESSARVLAALNIAFADAAVACWDAKYAYWYIRPSQLDPELKPLFPPPNHPSFPAAHGCLSTAAAAVLASAFRADRERLRRSERKRPRRASGPASTTASTSTPVRNWGARSRQR